MDRKTLQDLQLPRILEAAAALTQTARGREAVLALPDLAAPVNVSAELARVDEAMRLLDLPDHPSLDGAEDVGPQIETAGKGGVLSAPELIAAARLLRIGHEALAAVTHWKLRAPRIAEELQPIRDLLHVAERLEETFDDEGRIRDDASPRLGELRAKAVYLGRRVKERIEGMLKDSTVQPVLQDDYYTLREGRYVLPVKAEDHRFVPGIIHGTSRTGATIFVEPNAIVDDNNQLKVVLDAIEVEEYAILSDRSKLLGRYTADATALSAALWRLDTLLARGRLARKMDATLPRVGSGREALVLKTARNPILTLLGREVIPSTVDLGDGPGGRGLVVSGPNAGGKSVTLSTTGLCCCMARFGLLPPVAEGSVLPWYDRIYTVIGDPTNMDRAVSTFTGQLARLREVLERGKGVRTLVLLDELATGTEPRRGEALAVAVVRALVDSGAECLVTTHFDAIKQLAKEDPRFQNARVGQDGAGRPSYRLETGATGESNPFEVAASVGFPADVLDAARRLVDVREVRLDELLAETERLKAALVKERGEVEDLKRRLSDDKRTYEKELARLRSESDRLVYEARKEVLQKMKRLEEELDGIARQARQEQAEPRKVIVARQEVREKKQEVRRDMDREAALVANLPTEPFPAEKLVVGARAFVFNLRAEGEVVEVSADRKRAVVKVGLVKSNVKLADLRLPKPGAAKPKPPAQKDWRIPSKEARAVAPTGSQGIDDGRFLRTEQNSVDCRGMRVDEALAAVEKKLDEAFMNEIPAVMIIHGMGTSALRKAVREYLKGSRYSRSFRTGDPDEGGDGVTIASL
jgi:DNA mismatch repair protein MutS2